MKNRTVTRALKLCFNPLPDDKILGWSKVKAFSDDVSAHYQTTKFYIGPN